MAKNFYAVLGVAPTATEDEIRRRFRQLARERHPDRFEGEEKARAERDFQELTQAFNALADTERRRIHDGDLAGHGGGGGSRPATGTGPQEDQAALLRATLAQGVQLYRTGDHAAAADSFIRATKIDPGSPQAWYNLALTQSRQQGRSARAREAIERALALDPMKPSYLKLAGRLYADAGMKERAERYLEKALTWGGADGEIEQKLEELRGGGGRRGLFGKAR
jgi:curved DNA-binding protein CbpA